jgi:branched-chain amino acid transport system substrate-binding protein
MTQTIRYAGPSRRSVLKGAAAAAAATTMFTPWVAGAQAKVMRIGVPTILSGRLAELGSGSQNGAQMETDRINAAGGIAGRPVELVMRDSRGAPQEAARIVRELVTTDNCEAILDCEASSAAFAIREVARDLGFLVLQCVAETTSLSADPKLRLPNAFRVARSGIHDSISGGIYASNVAKQNNLRRWMTCSPDYAYGRDTTAQFVEHLKMFAPDVEIVADAWPKLFQPDYTEIITRIVQQRPQALFSLLFGGDLVSFIDQGNIYGLFGMTQFFAVNMADYTALAAVKNLPAGIRTGNRYLRNFPNTPENLKFAEDYRKRFNVWPNNWSWEAATGMRFLSEAAKKAGSSDPKKIAENLNDLKIASPFGQDGTITMRGEDRTTIGYALGWGVTVPKDPFVLEATPGNWTQILELEAAWKKKNNFA